MATFQLPPNVTAWVQQLARPLDARVAERLSIILFGVLFARGRRTVTSWLRAASVGHEFQLFYYFLGSLGRHVESVAGALLQMAVPVIAPGERLLFAIDDTPTKRYGPKVQGAGIHHNPTPGPAGAQFVYGHVWVMLAWVVRHSRWDTIGLPLRALMYVRQKDMAKLPKKTPKFRTKLTMAAEFIAWAADRLHGLEKALWFVVDGAYAKRPVFQAAKSHRVVLVSRLRKDAKLFDLPKIPKQRGRGRPRKYGDRISLVKRAAHRLGWQMAMFLLYGKEQTKTVKTFVAAYPPAGGVIRVVIVREESAWFAFCATDPQATVRDILEAVADRFAIEQANHDVKEVHGAGQQQLRNYWANVAAFHLNLWIATLIELWAWARPHGQLCDRTASPWDNPDRRPSHADRRNALRRRCLDHEYRHATAGQRLPRKIAKLFRAAFSWVA